MRIQQAHNISSVYIDVGCHLLDSFGSCLSEFRTLSPRSAYLSISISKPLKALNQGLSFPTLDMPTAAIRLCLNISKGGS